MSDSSTTTRGVVLTLIGGTFWGVSGTCAKFLMDGYGLDPVWIVAVRQFFAGWLFLALACASPRDRESLRGLVAARGGGWRGLAMLVATAACMICLGDKLPNGLLILLMVISAAAAGGIWGVIPAIFKAKWNTNETLFTLMMNYVATQLVAFFVIVWEVPKGAGQIGIINQNTEAGWLPWLFGQKYLLNILVVAILTGLVYIYLNYSKHGYEISVVGESERTARYVGIPVSRVIIRTMLLSGALCGIAGLLLVGGTDHTITTTIGGGRGFTAVMVSWMAKFNPVVMIFTSFLLVFLERGAGEISTAFGLNHSFSDILTGIILFFIIGSEFFITYQLSFRKNGKKED